MGWDVVDVADAAEEDNVGCCGVENKVGYLSRHVRESFKKVSPNMDEGISGCTVPYPEVRLIKTDSPTHEINMNQSSSPTVFFADLTYNLDANTITVKGNGTQTAARRREDRSMSGGSGPSSGVGIGMSVFDQA